MEIKEGFPSNLFITRAPWDEEADTIKLSDCRGKQIYRVDGYDKEKEAYLCCLILAGKRVEHWIPKDWIEQTDAARMQLSDWRESQLDENSRQLQYADLYRDLLWREFAGKSKKHQVGEIVRIKDKEPLLKTAFPHAWHEVGHPWSYGKLGAIKEAIRDVGVDGKLYRGYKVLVGKDNEYTDIWWLGEDLE